MRHIVALGGGYPDDAALHEYIVGLVESPRPKVCLIPTASGDAESYLLWFYRAFPSSRFDTSELTLFDRRIADLAAFVLDQDIIYVGGGNTANMLALWRLHRLDVVLRQAWDQGIVLCGASAGGMCWFEAGVTDSFGPELEPLRDLLGFIPGSFCPHYDSEAGRRSSFEGFVAAGLPAGYACDDQVGLHFQDTELAAIVSAREGAAAYRVERANDGTVEESRLNPRLLRN